VVRWEKAGREKKKTFILSHTTLHNSANGEGLITFTQLIAMSVTDASTSQQGNASSPMTPDGYTQPVQDISQATPQAGGSGMTGSAQPQTRQAAEEARKDRTLAEFMLMLDEYEPLVRLQMFMVSNG
jgi:hypothetical protein